MKMISDILNRIICASTLFPMCLIAVDSLSFTVESDKHVFYEYEPIFVEFRVQNTANTVRFVNIVSTEAQYSLHLTLARDDDEPRVRRGGMGHGPPTQWKGIELLPDAELFDTFWLTESMGVKTDYEGIGIDRYLPAGEYVLVAQYHSNPNYLWDMHLLRANQTPDEIKRRVDPGTVPKESIMAPSFHFTVLPLPDSLGTEHRFFVESITAACYGFGGMRNVSGGFEALSDFLSEYPGSVFEPTAVWTYTGTSVSPKKRLSTEIFERYIDTIFSNHCIYHWASTPAELRKAAHSYPDTRVAKYAMFRAIRKEKWLMRKQKLKK